MKQFKDPRTIYFYDNFIQLIDTYPSANEASHRSGIPKSTLLHYCDKKKLDPGKKTLRRERTFSPVHGDLVIISSVRLKKNK